MTTKTTKVYLDYAASTPLDPRVLSKMLPYFDLHYGNTSSIHSFGQEAEAGLEAARGIIAESLNCKADEIIFTSGGTESDNLALRGTAFAERIRRSANHILISPVEHPAVSRTARQLAEIFKFELEFLSIDAAGMVDPDDVARKIKPTTALVSVIYANNEIGTINPIPEIGAICRNRGIPFHTDAVQAAAHLPPDVNLLNVDLMSLGAHKFYGPKGIGALYLRNQSQRLLIPQITGGSQEFGYRGGTHNTPYIVGMAEALHLAQIERSARHTRLVPLRDYLIGQVLESVQDAQLTGHMANRLPNHASFAFKGADGNELLMLLDIAGFACSSGSACKTGNPEPSEVLSAIGLDRTWALGSLRITLGYDTNEEMINALINILPTLVNKTRSRR